MDNSLIIHKSDTNPTKGINIVINETINKNLDKDAINKICESDAMKIYIALCKYLPILTMSHLLDLMNSNEYL